MRYVIGAKVPNNNGSIADGLYVWGKYGLPYILTSNNYGDDSRIIIFNNLDEVNEYLKELRNSYYKEFHDRAARYNLKIEDFKFYALKFDTPKMNHIKIGGFIYSKNKKYRLYDFQVFNSN